MTANRPGQSGNASNPNRLSPAVLILLIGLVVATIVVAIIATRGSGDDGGNERDANNSVADDITEPAERDGQSEQSEESGEHASGSDARDDNDLPADESHDDALPNDDAPNHAPDDRPEPLADHLPWCDADELPATTLPVVDAVLDDGPFDHPDHDGGRFGNYEGLLPEEYLGYYREYTVETPGLNHRGARRIVTGGEDAAEPDVWFYTEDHYESFCEIDLDEVLAD